jgi:hypothetical protein
VLLYSSKGHPAVYYRTLVGAENDERYFEAKTQDRLASQRANGEPEDVTKSRDTRDLDRGPIALAAYEKALAEGYRPAITIRALNALWDRHGAVRTNHVVEMKNPDPAIVSYARHATDSADPPLLQLVNLSGDKKTVSFPIAALRDELGWSDVEKPGALVDILAQELARGGAAARDIEVRVAGGQVTFELPPYGTAMLQDANASAG